MKNRIGKISLVVLFTVVILLLAANLVIRPVFGTPIMDISTYFGGFTGPANGTAQDDNVKASLDLAHTDLDAIIVDGTQAATADGIAAASALPSYSHSNYLLVTATMTSATWNTAAAHEIAAVTGAVRMTIMAECTADIVTVDANGTIALGYAGNTAAIWAAAALDTWDNTEVAMGVTAGVPTFPIGGGDSGSALTHCLFDIVAVGGIDVGYTIGTNAATTGVLKFHIWWTPLDSTGAVTAGAGGVF